ncbi:hypothetical protein [Rhizobium hidalgonense]|uniref:hypothetical protein n=1 Tax=Rhizobium hidalgonense TaxID=1538159 RepID=UPI0013E35402|nr:hypothetical protein [Rhizobium hidalgonense]
MNAKLQILGILAVISLGATDVSLVLQEHFGRTSLLILIGPTLAAVASGILALLLEGRR